MRDNLDCGCHVLDGNNLHRCFSQAEIHLAVCSFSAGAAVLGS